MNKLLKIIITYLITITIINLLFWTLVGIRFPIIKDVYRGGLIIEIPQTKTAYIFAHGGYEFDNQTKIYEHKTTYKNQTISTKQMIDRYIEEGYEKIWLSQCGTGNQDYIYFNYTEEFDKCFNYGMTTPDRYTVLCEDSIIKNKISWTNYPQVSRNKHKGNTLPIFTGIGFIRI